MQQQTTIESAMTRAVELAARGLGRTAPNPVVGCVVLDAAGRVVGEGWHARAGGPHAEVMALAEAGDAARGGTAVVTLEPCRHTGRTGPCTGALLDAGVDHVVVAVPDPTKAAGGGADLLRDNGIDVIEGIGHEAAAHGNRAWLHAMATGRPLVTWKLASTLDGRTAAADGTSRWITGPQARADVHRLRAQSDAVLVGGATLRADDPHLAVRDIDGAVQPLRVVIDSRAEVPLTARVLDDAAPTLVVVAEGADAARLRAADVDVLAVPADLAGLDLAAVLAGLHERDGARSCSREERTSRPPSSRPTSSTRSSPTSHRRCSGPARRSSRTPASPPSPRRCASPPPTSSASATTSPSRPP